jgi:putative transposase
LLKIKVHRPLEGTPVTAHLVLRADGHWYALIVCETTPQDAFGEAHPTQADCEHPAIGLHVGLTVFLADSEGSVVETPRHYRRGQKRGTETAGQKRLAHGQRTVSRRKQGRQRRKKASREVACQHLKISRQRRDFHFKTAKQYAERYSRICVEDLNITGMVRNRRLAKSIHDASWSAFLDILTDKAERAGHVVIRVPALHDAAMQRMWGVCPEESERAHPSRSFLRTGRRPRRERCQEYRTGRGAAFRDGSRWAAG